MRWPVVLSVMCVVVVLVALGVQAGYVTPPGELVRELASRPDVATKFHDRFDASVFLFTTLLITPIAVVGALCTLALLTIVIDGTVMQVGRSLGLPNAMVGMFVALTAVGVAWAQADAWVPGSLKLLGMIARAYVMSTT
jgi:hypothetical protein